MLRALAIVLVVGEHDHLWTWLGGAHLLLAIAGWTFSRFLLTRTDDQVTTTGAPSRLPWRILRSAALIAVPSSLWILLRVHRDRVGAARRTRSCSGRCSTRWCRATGSSTRWCRSSSGSPCCSRCPRCVASSAATGSRCPRSCSPPRSRCGWIPSYDHTVTSDLYSTHLVRLAVRARLDAPPGGDADRSACVTVAASLVLVPSFFGTEYERAAIVAGRSAGPAVRRPVRVPRLLVAPVTAVAGASLGIYLTHFALLHLLDVGVPPAVLVVLGLALGVVAWRLGTAATQQVVRYAAAARPAPRPAAARRRRAEGRGRRRPAPERRPARRRPRAHGPAGVAAAGPRRRRRRVAPRPYADRACCRRHRCSSGPTASVIASSPSPRCCWPCCWRRVCAAGPTRVDARRGGRWRC